MKIEPVTEATFSIAASIYTKSWRESHRQICSPEFLKLRDCSGYLWKKIDQLYMITDEQPVGVFCLYEGLLSDLYIHPDHQGKGYGTACVKFGLSRYPKLRLTVMSSNLRAISLYRKLGFSFTGNNMQRKEGLQEREMIYSE